MSDRYDNIQNPVVRKLAQDLQSMSRGDFGMTVYGGVDLEEFANQLVERCAQVCQRHVDATWNDDRKTQARLDRDEIRNILK